MPVPDNSLPLALVDTAHLSAVAQPVAFAKLLSDFFDAQRS